MILRILKAIGLFIWKSVPTVLITLAFLALFNVQVREEQELLAIKAQVAEQATNNASYYEAVLQVDQALAGADIQLAASLDKVRADDAKQSDALIKTIYAVDKKAEARSQGIVDGVNQVVDGVNNALSKPSYTYLKAITVKIIARDKSADYLPDGQKGWLGTGVILAINQDFTYILTNRHVMQLYGDGTHDYYVKDGDDKYTITAIKISNNENVDLALIRINGHIDGKIAVRGFGEVKPQDPVYMVGMNLGRPFFYAEGTVSGFDPQSQDELVVGMPTGPGNSGSGVINKDGLLVGLLYAGAIIDQEGIKEMDIAHGLCIPIKAIRLFLASYIS